MSYELTIELTGGRIEIEADTPAQLQRRVRALDLAALEAAIAQARRAATPAKRTKSRRARG